MVDKEKFRDYVYSMARARGTDVDDEEAMEDLAEELLWEWYDIKDERDAGSAVIVEMEKE